MTAFSDSEIYPNAPLEDVVCELRFPGEMEVECNRHLFWNAIRDEYPQILVPHAIPDKAPALQHYRFVSANNARKISVALNSLAFSDTEYGGHEEFCSEFFRIVEIFIKTFGRVEKLSRAGWRYINVIPYVRDQESIPIKSFLNVGMLLPEDVLERPKAFDLKAETQLSEGVAIVRLASISRKDASEKAQEAILLDIDFGCESEELKMSDFRKHIEFARSHNRRLFEELITDDYREYLRGEML